MAAIPLRVTIHRIGTASVESFGRANGFSKDDRLAGSFPRQFAILSPTNSGRRGTIPGGFVARVPFERMTIMFKSTLFALVTAAGSAACTDSALACHRQACCANTCAAPACAAVAPADPHAGMQMPQANRGAAYQSFSYEPGAAPQMQAAPVYQPMRRPSAPSFYDTVRGDRKALGRY